MLIDILVPSVLWRCWLGGSKGIRPVKKLSGGMLAWLYVWVRELICIWPSWCHCHSLSLAPVNQDSFYLPGLTFLVLAHPGSPGQNPRGPLNGCVRACVHACDIWVCYSCLIWDWIADTKFSLRSNFGLSTHTHTHTTILRPSWILSGTTWVSQHQKG